MSADGDPAPENQAQDEPSVPCLKCGKPFRTARGALQHQRQCKIVAERVELPPESQPLITPDDNNVEQHPETFYWGDIKGSD